MSDQMLQVLIEGYDPEKAQREEYDKYWKEVYGAYQNNSILQATLMGIETKLNKPCGVVNIGNIRGYIPLEFSGCDDFIQLRQLSGANIAFKVINYDRDGDVFTASRKAALEHMASVTWKRLELDRVIMAVARTVTEDEVIADIGGVQVTIPISEIDYGWIDDLTEKVKVGDHLRVKVTKLDKEHQVVEVSAKATKQNPWPDCTKRYFEHSEYVGRVSGVREYGEIGRAHV